MKAGQHWPDLLVAALALLLIANAKVQGGSQDPTLVAHYTFDEGSGAVLHDRSGHGHDGKITGPAWVRGDVGGALDFCSSDVVDCGDRFYLFLHRREPIQGAGATVAHPVQ